MATELNARMIERMKASRAIRSLAVESAFQRNLRHLFVPGVALDLVYSGNALVTRSDPERGITSSSSEVAIMAPMLEMLRLEPGHRVLEIGAGTGYNAALLDDLVGADGEVTSIDNQPDVLADAQAHLSAAGRSHVRAVTGDGYRGWPEGAPYDRIIATASVRDIPLAWRDQLREGGLLVVPVRFGPVAQLVATFRRHGDRLDSVEAVAGGFMPLRTEGQQLEEPLKVAEDLNVGVAPACDGDTELLSDLLQREPVIEPFDSYPALALFSLGGIIEPDWLVIRPRGRNGMWMGLLDRPSRSLALIASLALPTGANLANVLVYGSATAAERLKRLVTELENIAVERVEVDAVPTGAPPPEADVVHAQANFTYAIHWRKARRP